MPHQAPMVGDMWAHRDTADVVHIVSLRGSYVYYREDTIDMVRRLAMENFLDHYRYHAAAPSRLCRAARLTLFCRNFILGAALVIALAYLLWRM